jgi:hypothetical protein
VTCLIAELAHVDLQRCNVATAKFAQAVLPQCALEVNRWSTVQYWQQRGFLSHPASPLFTTI